MSWIHPKFRSGFARPMTLMMVPSPGCNRGLLKVIVIVGRGGVTVNRRDQHVEQMMDD